jgi:hypothetical protein
MNYASARVIKDGVIGQPIGYIDMNLTPKSYRKLIVPYAYY